MRIGKQVWNQCSVSRVNSSMLSVLADFFFDFANEIVSHYGFNLHFPRFDEVEHLFISLLAFLDFLFCELLLPICSFESLDFILFIFAGVSCVTEQNVPSLGLNSSLYFFHLLQANSFCL